MLIFGQARYDYDEFQEVSSTLTRELESYRAELEAAFCPVTEELDLTRTEREGIGFEHR